MSQCLYEGRVNLENLMCWNCSLFLVVCTPVAASNGYALGSELDCWLCEGCQVECKLNFFAEV